MTFQTISPQKLEELRQESGEIDLIDVRMPFEFRGVHVEYARNVPLDKLDCQSIVQSRNGRGGEPLYIVCRSGSRGKQACEKFVAAGFTNVVNVEGGTLACVDAGLPVVRGKETMSLSRQVQIIAGLLIVAGVVLGTFNSYFYWLSAAMGAGLTFSGITDTCAMGMILAKMPWNQVKEEAGDQKAGKCAC